MARPRKEEAAKQTRYLVARATEAEYACATSRAAQAGVSLSEYVRRMALHGQIIVRPPRGPDMVVAYQLRRIGINLNQMMPAFHLGGRMPPDLERLWAKLETILDGIIEAD